MTVLPSASEIKNDDLTHTNTIEIRTDRRPIRKSREDKVIDCQVG